MTGRHFDMLDMFKVFLQSDMGKDDQERIFFYYSYLLSVCDVFKCWRVDGALKSPPNLISCLHFTIYVYGFAPAC